MRRRLDRQPLPAKALAAELPAKAWQEIAWREATNAAFRSRFAAVHLRPASRDFNRAEPHAEERLLTERPEDEREPAKYWLSTLPGDPPITQLVDTAKPRWRIERNYQELQQEPGLGHDEGRVWRGFHHASLCIAAYGFLISLKETIPPSQPAQTGDSQTTAHPPDHRPRSAPGPARATRAKVDPNPAKATDCRPGQPHAAMSMPRKSQRPISSLFCDAVRLA
jgi:hypothetical protein